MARARFRVLTALTAGLVIAGGGVAWADNVQNDVVAGGNDTITSGGSTTVNYRINGNNGDGQNGCNANDGSSATVTINAPSGVVASPGSLTFSACDTNKPVTFNSTTAGTYEITVSVSDGGAGTYNTNPAKFTLHVNAPVNTAPTLALPSALTAEATGPTGATVTYAATASDAQDGPLTPTCSPVSGSNFAVGQTTVTCSATDSGGLSTSGSFKVTVRDTTGPGLSLPANITEEATGPTGAAVTYSATASDAVAGSVPVTCSPASGDEFALGTTTVNCSATDGTNPSTGSFTVTVRDTAGPVFDLPDDITTEATSGSGAIVGYTVTASDAVAGSVPATCSPASGSAFALGTTTVNCSATDGTNPSTGSFTVTVEDTAGPILFLPANMTEEATGPDGAPVTYSASASDLVDGPVTVTCDPASGGTFALGTTTVECSATDAAGNPASGTFTVTVEDTKAPTGITFVGGPADGGTYYYAGVPGEPTCTATDTVDTDVSCIVTGYSNAIGSYKLTATATDNFGNTATAERTYTVAAWTDRGFYSPVDMNGVWNAVKGGSTVPLKFEVFAGSTELTSTAVVQGFTVKGVSCPGASAPTDDIELTTTGGTSLRYDASAGQFIQNWATPKKPGSCYAVTMTTLDGSSLTANFKLK